MLKFLIAAIVLLEIYSNPVTTAIAHMLICIAIVVLAVRLPRIIGDFFRPARQI